MAFLVFCWRFYAGLIINPVTLIAIGIVAFAATNIDDILLLSIFFSDSSRHRPRHVVIGQYAGFILLVAISGLAAFLGLVVPAKIIALFGILPILIGVKKLLEKPNILTGSEVQTGLNLGRTRHRPMISISRVATVTFSSGSDNIGVYVPLFAGHGTSIEIIIIVATFLGMTGLWCIIGRYGPRNRHVAKQLERFGHLIFPFALIGIGIAILVEGFV